MNGDRTQFRDVDGFTFTDTGRTNYSPAEDPTVDGDGILVFDLNQMGWNPVSYCALGSMNNQLVRGHYPGLEPGQWDAVYGDQSTPSMLYVNAPLDSVIWYATESDYIVSCINCAHGVIDLECSYAGRGIELVGCTDIDITLTTFAVGRGITVRDCQNIRIHSGNFERCGSDAVHISGGCSDILIDGNKVYRAGESVSIAGVYVNGTQAGPVEIRENRVSDTSFGRYWPFDGAGIMVDEAGDNTHAHDNTVIGCHLALVENSPGAGNRFDGNTLMDNDHAINITDSAHTGLSTLVYQNNMLINTPEGGPFGQPDPAPNYRMTTP